MASKRKTAKGAPETFPRKTIPAISGTSDDERGRSFARAVMSPELAAYRLIGMMQAENIKDGIDAPTMLATLRDQAAAAQNGDTALSEAMLINQASALQAMFVRLTERGMEQTHMPNLEGFIRLALRAQSQCRAALETLATIKNPPVIYARQANISNGPQQVNNGEGKPTFQTSTRPRAHTGEKEIPETKLLETQSHEWLDTGAAEAAGGVDQDMETVGAVDWAKNGGR
jgi:hypothetical protein